MTEQETMTMHAGLLEIIGKAQDMLLRLQAAEASNGTRTRRRNGPQSQSITAKVRAWLKEQADQLPDVFTSSMVKSGNPDFPFANISAALRNMSITGETEHLSAEEGDKIMSDPVPIRLPCPSCHQLHIDEGEFATKPHHTHSCQHCGLTWRPAVIATVGVRFLPGFKNDDDAIDWSGVLPHHLRVSCSKCSSDTNSPGTYGWVFKDGKWYCENHDPARP